MRAFHFFLAFLLTGLGTLQTEAQTTPEANSLQAEIDNYSAEMASKLPAKMRKKFAEGIQVVHDSGIAKNSLQVGAQVPNAQLLGSGKEPIELAKLWAEGPLVLTFYRGGWCPYCNLQLKALERSLSKIENAGATLVAVTPEIPEKVSETVDNNQLGYLVLTDKDNALAHKFGIAFTLPDVIRPIYENHLKLSSYNGNDKSELPLAATYIIDRQGIIRWAFSDADYKHRAEPSDIVNAVVELFPNKTDK